MKVKVLKTGITTVIENNRVEVFTDVNKLKPRAYKNLSALDRFFLNFNKYNS